ncbi:hypothetical protein [Latilactobacillus curvatus]|uniref:hypothetical protein n=1 Tax=Latilactobacillus curvatus TaxID=28038 RepID=UPI000FECDF70|nr:hypothetical protein [Latilactobacillus curvatus]QAR35275.1 hypothetical protein EQK21_04110 [Latilactobacillus curvatus]
MNLFDKYNVRIWTEITSLGLIILGPIHLINIKLQDSFFNKEVYLKHNFKFYVLFSLTITLAIYLLLFLNSIDKPTDEKIRLKKVWPLIPAFVETSGFASEVFKMDTFHFCLSLVYSSLTAFSFATMAILFFKAIKTWLKNNSDISLQVTLIVTIITSIVSIITALIK